LHEKEFISDQDFLGLIHDTLTNNGRNYQFNPDQIKILGGKKHYVYLCSFNESPFHRYTDKTQFVVKLFNPKIRNYKLLWEQEITNYHNFKDKMGIFHLPQILDSMEFMIIYEFISGLSFQDMIIRKTITDFHIDVLAEWFVFIHNHNYAYKDPRLFNFIFTPSNVFYILDLEEMENGEVSDDIPHLLSSFIDLSPGIFDKKINEDIINSLFLFIDKFSQKLKKSNQSGNLPDIYTDKWKLYWLEQIMIGLKETAKRREIPFPRKQQARIKNVILTESNLFFGKKN